MNQLASGANVRVCDRLKISLIGCGKANISQGTKRFIIGVRALQAIQLRAFQRCAQ